MSFFDQIRFSEKNTWATFFSDENFFHLMQLRAKRNKITQTQYQFFAQLKPPFVQRPLVEQDDPGSIPALS